MAEQHDWHMFDAERELEVRQITPDGSENRWEVRFASGETVILNDDEFDQLRSGGPVELSWPL